MAGLMRGDEGVEAGNVCGGFVVLGTGVGIGARGGYRVCVGQAVNTEPPQLFVLMLSKHRISKNSRGNTHTICIAASNTDIFPSSKLPVTVLNVFTKCWIISNTPSSPFGPRRTSFARFSAVLPYPTRRLRTGSRASHASLGSSTSGQLAAARAIGSSSWPSGTSSGTASMAVCKSASSLHACAHPGSRDNAAGVRRGTVDSRLAG